MTRPGSGTAPGARAGQWRQRVRLVTALVTGALLLALTGITLADVTGRYLLSRPLPGAAEITELLVMAIVFTGLPAICLDDGHITVDIFTTRLTGRAEAVQTLMSRLLVGAILALVAWELWKHGTRIGGYNSTTVYLRIPLAPAAYAASLLCAASAAIVVVMGVLRLPRGRSEEF